MPTSEGFGSRGDGWNSFGFEKTHNSGILHRFEEQRFMSGDTIMRGIHVDVNKNKFWQNRNSTILKKGFFDNVA